MGEVNDCADFDVVSAKEGHLTGGLRSSTGAATSESPNTSDLRTGGSLLVTLSRQWLLKRRAKDLAAPLRNLALLWSVSRGARLSRGSRWFGLRRGSIPLPIRFQKENQRRACRN